MHFLWNSICESIGLTNKSTKQKEKISEAIMHKKLLFSLIILFLSTYSIAQDLPGGIFETPPMNLGRHFMHIATAGNSSGNFTIIDNSLTNNKPNAKLFISHDWKGSGTGTYNNHANGLWYNGTKWTIFNQDSGVVPIVVNSAYHILVADESKATVFQHTARPNNITSNWTIITNPATDGKPNARLLVTQILIDTAGNTYNNHEIGVWYNGSKWGIFNQDLATMPNGASFNVMVLDEQSSILHKATTDNILSATTKIDHPYLNNNPNALIYITQNWNPGGGSGVYNSKKVGVYYYGNNWSIFNEDFSAMTPNTYYNVYIGSPYFVHKSDSTNISGDLTTFDNPIINTDSSARIFVMHNWNPYGTGTSVFNKTLGVYHNGSEWGIYTEDATVIPQNIYYNVAIAPKTDSAFLHTTTAANISGGNYTTIDNPLLNSNPNAKLLVQHRFITSRDTSNLGVWYNASSSKWTIFTEDQAVMPANKHFNVWLLNDNKSFIHTVDSASISLQDNYSVLDNPLTNGNPDANILITPLLATGNGYFDHVIGVWYYSATQRWYLYVEDGTPFPIGLKYIVYVANASGIPTSVEEENNPAAVVNFELQQNFPNPFNPTTQIRFSLSEQSQVTLKVYNILGKEITTLVNDVKSAGVHEVSFDGSGLASGVYFYTLQAGKQSQTHKMILIK